MVKLANTPIIRFKKDKKAFSFSDIPRNIAPPPLKLAGNCVTTHALFYLENK
jgi:hypothetical protein